MDEELASRWCCDDVAEWLSQNGFGEYTELLTKTHKIDGQILVRLTENDLRKKPLNLTVLGDIKRIGIAVERLRIKCGSNDESYDLSFDSLTCSRSSKSNINRTLSRDFVQRHMVIEKIESLDTPLWCMIKTALAAVYCCISLLLTSFVMVIVHDRVPDMKTYPPLPDLVLDSIPFISWAFEVCELLACILGIIWCLVIVFHKRRTILLRRMFSLTGTVFFLRCITMLITSLSVPGVHLECKSQQSTDLSTKFKQALRIWYGMGMSLRGVRTCGDYMFSGHTTVVTLLNHFVTEYTPEDWYYLHTASWVMNLFSIFFILAGHEHYSIDVFVAFYISSRLFLYYHSMAYHTRSMTASDGRTRMWFPLFWFFESGLEVGRVENEYEIPLPSWPTIKNWCRCCLRYYLFFKIKFGGSKDGRKLTVKSNDASPNFRKSVEHNKRLAGVNNKKTKDS